MANGHQEVASEDHQDALVCLALVHFRWTDPMDSSVAVVQTSALLEMGSPVDRMDCLVEDKMDLPECPGQVWMAYMVGSVVDGEVDQVKSDDGSEIRVHEWDFVGALFPSPQIAADMRHVTIHYS